MAVPFYVTLAKQRATAFRCEAELLAANFRAGDTDRHLENLWDVVWPQRGNGRSTVGDGSPIDVPSVVHEALVWSHSATSQPADIRRAKSELEAALSEWLAAWKTLAQMVASRAEGSGDTSSERRAITAAAAQYDQAKTALATQWPLTEGDDDRAAPAELEAAGGIEMDDAFALLSGVGRDEWRKMVAAHPRGAQSRNTG